MLKLNNFPKQTSNKIIFLPHVRIQRGGRGGPDPPPSNLENLISPLLMEIKKYQLFFIFVHFHSYTSRLDPPWKNFLDPRLFYRYFVNQVSRLSMRSAPFARKSVRCLNIYLHFIFVFYLISNHIFVYINHKDTC